MSKAIFPLHLHIAKPDDTLESIASKYQTTVEEILSLNVSLRYKKLISGMPINVKDQRVRKLEINFEETKTNPKTLNELCYLTKEMIIAKFSSSPLINSLKNTYASSLNEILKLKNLYTKEFEDFCLEFSFLTIEFLPALESKSQEKIKELQESMDDLYLNLDNIIPSNLSSTSLIYFCKMITKYWQLYILKLLTQNYEESEAIFLSILDKFNNLSIKKPND